MKLRGIRGVGVMLKLALVCALANLSFGLEWWQVGPIYQVYPASFADSNGDGWGDLKGILEHADYFKEIGVGAVWLSPIFTSPMKDNGYDVSNYVDINPIYGTLEDLVALKDKLHGMNIKIMLDFVPNHSSDQHPWFNKSVHKEDGYDDFYVWRDARGTKLGPDGQPTYLHPNNWRSFFTPHAWTWNDIRQQFYYHQFGSFQPDLNYANPKVLEAMKNVVDFWMKFGIDGLRVDAAPNLYENHYDLDQPLIKNCPLPPDDYHCQVHIYSEDQPELYTIIGEFAKVLGQYNGNGTRYQFIEAYTSINNTMRYYMNSTSPFNFNILEFLQKDANASDMHRTIDNWIKNMPENAWPNWVSANHDNPRVASRYGEEMVDIINTLLFMLPGTPITYQGEEIGMSDTNIPEGMHQDTSVFDRDPERTPMQWNKSRNAGFSRSDKPFLPVNTNYWRINVESEKADEKSHLNVYKKLSSLHKELSGYGVKDDFHIYIVSPWVFGFTRPNTLVLMNLNNVEETFSLADVKNSNKKIPDKLHTKILSSNSNFAQNEMIDASKGITMRPRSSAVFVYSFSSHLASSAPLILVAAILSYFRL